MKSIFKLLVFIGAVVLCNSAYAQNILMGEVGHPLSNPADCNTFGVGATNFVDDGNGADYSPNFNDTTVFCPDLNTGTKMTVTFATNAGFEFNVHGSDSIYVYDGPDTSAPLLGVHNSDTDPNGFAYTASWNNPSGCLTVVFISDGANQASGWVGSATCGDQNQPFEPHIEAYVNGTGANALDPVDTGFVDVCFGDSILFIAKPIFPHSEESTGFGYSQTIDNVTYEWEISDGGTYPNNDSIWFTPPTRNGFLVDLKITDMFPQIERMLCKVRVSQLPLFTGTGPLEDTVCMGENTNLIGGTTATDTVGIDVPGGSFLLGGAFAGLTYLPDGSGAQYQAPIDISDFPAGTTIQSASDLANVCITMEHSYMGDLEIALECPNGTQVPIMNSYSPGFIPGGNSGSGTFLGHPFDDISGGGPGVGWEYCFSSVLNTVTGSMTQNLGNTVAVNLIPANPPTQPNDLSAGNSMDPADVYEPESPYDGFIGCPVNGTWTIIVQDNLGTDDGYIFEWGLFFDGSLLGDLGSYQNTIVDDFWHDDPTIVSGQDDTVLVVQPDTPGQYGYTFEVEDDFGCHYDTTVYLEVLPQPTIFTDTFACNFSFDVTGTTSYNGGYWTSTDPNVSFQPDSLAENPDIWASTAGVYTVTFTDNACNSEVSAVIDFLPYPSTWLNDTTICSGSSYTIVAPNDNVHTTTYEWSTGETGESITVSEPGTYYLTLMNDCHTNHDTITVNTKLCDIDAPNVISLAQGSQNSLWYVNADGLTEFDLVITNRWGNVVYECSDANAKCYWDGRNKGGAFVEEGTYFYSIKSKTESGEELNKHGFIQVVY